MTAEALVCWQFLGMQARRPGQQRGGRLPARPVAGPRRGQRLLLVLWHPGHVSIAGRALAAVERGPAAAIAGHATRPAAPWPAAGTPTPAWGSYGGRIYSTSLSALCLEVYYRYLPLYAQVN